jgi:hypothetical protein
MADTLTVNSRNFYENAKLKFAASLMIGAATMMLLGFTSVNGGESKANQLVADNINAAGWVEDCYNALAAGYGFASFVHILGFILILAAAIYISPFLCGSVYLYIHI